MGGTNLAMQIKVCHIAHQTWPSVCGSVSRLENILAAQKKAGVDVFVISSPFQVGETLKDIELNNGVKYYRCNSSGSGGVKNSRTLLERIKRGFSIFSYTKKIFDICKREAPDVIHAHATFFMGIPALIVGAVLRKPVVYEMRSTWEEDVSGGVFIGLQRRLIKFLEYFTGKRSGLIFFVSKGIMRHYYERDPDNYKIIYNAVSAPGCRQETNGSSMRLHSFGYVGSVVSYEGLEVLVEAVALLLKCRRDFQVHIYGEGDARKGVVALAEKLGVADLIEFHGRIEFSEIQSAYAAIDTIVLPRRDLPITQKVAGLKPVEAFSYQKLVLAADVGGMRELFVDKVHGYFFTPEDPEALSALMSLVIDKKVNAEEVVGRAFEYYKERFTLESMGGQYVSSYRKVLEK
ncbi:glycosyltransferase [Pseudomonas sp. L-22-4S-12]|nr:glycosyltransferase [Pseudomonas sp. L-22-4S-12]